MLDYSALLRDYITAGTPSSGAYKIRKADLRALIGELQAYAAESAQRAASISDLKAIDQSLHRVVLLDDLGRGGFFFWKTGDFSALIAADTREGIYVKANAVAANAGAWVRSYFGRVRAEWFGIIADYDDDTKAGTNNNAAFAAMLATVAAIALINDNVAPPIGLPAGKILLDQVAYSGRYLDIAGDSEYGSVIVGTSATNDIFSLGTGASEMNNLKLANLTIDSKVTKTAGCAIRARRITRSTFENVILAGQDRQQTYGKRLWDGAWFDGCDFCIWDGFQIVTQSFGLRVNGEASYGGAQGDLFLDNGKIYGCDKGIHVAGGFGGLTVGKVDVIANNYNLVVDASVVSAHANREIYLQPGAFFDNAGVHNVYVYSSLQKLVISGGWLSSAAQAGLVVVSMAGQILIGGGTIIKGNGTDAIYANDPATQWVFCGCEIANNGGYGLHFVTAPSNADAVVGLASILFSANTSGSTLNLPFLRLSASSDSGDIEVDGIVNGDLRLRPSGTGVVNFEGAGAFTAGSPVTANGWINVKINGTPAKIFVKV